MSTTVAKMYPRFPQPWFPKIGERWQPVGTNVARTVVSVGDRMVLLYLPATGAYERRPVAQFGPNPHPRFIKVSVPPVPQPPMPPT